jgi:thiol-disulfide isomerase/thioredoxin
VTAPTGPKAPPVSLIEAARLRRDGRPNDAVALVEAALARAREKPLDQPFWDRVQLGLALADLFLATGRHGRARGLLESEAACADEIYRHMRQTGSPEQVRTASAGLLQLRDRATQVALLGRAAPEIEVADWVTGQPTTLAEQRGRVVLLEFWATWCRPCLTMFPVMRELHSRYAERGLTIIALTRYVESPSGDPLAEGIRQRDAICQTIADRGLEFAVGIAPDGRLQQTYGAIGIPALALVDRAGIVAPAPPAPDKAKLENTIADLLDSPIGP